MISFQFSLETIETIEEVIDHKKYLINYEELSEKSRELLNAGVFYQNGRDFQFRPIIVVDISKINTKNMDDNMVVQSLCCLLNEIKYNMLIPGYIENWVILLDFGGKGIFGMPVKLIGKIIQNLSKNYCGHLEQLYICNPSKSLQFIWGSLSSFMDDDVQKKITFIKSKKEFQILLKVIPAQQLESKFFGLQPNVQNYFPPKNTIPFNINDLKKNNQKLIGEKLEDDQQNWKIRQFEQEVTIDKHDQQQKNKQQSQLDTESCESSEKSKENEQEQQQEYKKLEFCRNQSHELNLKEIEENTLSEKKNIENKLANSVLEPKQKVMINDSINYDKMGNKFMTRQPCVDYDKENEQVEYYLVKQNLILNRKLHSMENQKSHCKGCNIF
ncbi:CRAL-TRIO domain [Pseudocohnilembus persalinus]|uniref:CRAL-TRIO domain n=1 Tax=Pseudocohnilembus persalinus TaxID=266149 RepID=A0A0V0QAE8_PSEPJ|nr:CRAL-TRIO domain [Pseudocohnilembus persalinus]|eukprot:KRW99212.1 CRAL-TRIO domain [Pseudocohnilembus persalinus]